MLEILLRKLEVIGPLSPEERELIGRLPGVEKRFAAGEDMVHEGDEPTHSTLLLTGFACRHKALPSGRRQILALHTPGDFVDLHALLLRPMDHSIGALAPCTVLQVPHPALYDAVDRHPRIARSFWRDTLVEASVYREWLMGLGRRSAYGRIAHLLCEILVRLRAVRLIDGYQYALPLTQTELADSLGLSLVHVNRILQRLRTERLATFHNRTVEIHDWERLQAVADFSPEYLHLHMPKGGAW